MTSRLCSGLCAAPSLTASISCRSSYRYLTHRIVLIAAQEIDQIGQHSPQFARHQRDFRIEAFDVGWVFYYQSARLLETADVTSAKRLVAALVESGPC